MQWTAARSQTTLVNRGPQEQYTYDLWDAKKMRSCWCNQSMSVNAMFSGVTTTYRGPYALTDTDSHGYDCSLGRLASTAVVRIPY